MTTRTTSTMAATTPQQEKRKKKKRRKKKNSRKRKKKKKEEKKKNDKTNKKKDKSKKKSHRGSALLFGNRTTDHSKHNHTHHFLHHLHHTDTDNNNTNNTNTNNTNNNEQQQPQQQPQPPQPDVVSSDSREKVALRKERRLSRLFTANNNTIGGTKSEPATPERLSTIKTVATATIPASPVDGGSMTPPPAGKKRGSKVMQTLRLSQSPPATSTALHCTNNYGHGGVSSSSSSGGSGSGGGGVEEGRGNFMLLDVIEEGESESEPSLSFEKLASTVKTPKGGKSKKLHRKGLQRHKHATK
eukprot:TRINITY_DN5917_c1_g5_i1.p1 TRINITY_DN5917_c1_g5~~TRINITY_DN5917_c1_g5_i1.p1  ORF type:complete len:300 (-),score=138.59 TRINITY_DN5917_c1_g5_i1:27-926(-)